MWPGGRTMPRFGLHGPGNSRLLHALFVRRNENRPIYISSLYFLLFLVL